MKNGINTSTLKITPKLLKLISEIDEFKGAWKALGILAPERLTALKKVATIESVGSSTRIEGSKLSDREVSKLLSGLEIESFENRDEEEVVGYARVMELVFDSWNHIPVDENHIKQLHRDLLKYSSKDAIHRGQYKTAENSVAAFDKEGKQIGIVFKTATPFDTPRLMEELVEWLKFEQRRQLLHPLLIIGIFVVVFLEIHPFRDGNGRLSRILTMLLLLQSGYEYVPYSSAESIIEHNKRLYYLTLRRTQKSIRKKNPDWQPWINFFLEVMKRQKTKLLRKLEHEKMVLTSIPNLSLQIIEFAKSHGRVSMNEIMRSTKVSRNTLKQHFRKLVKNGFLIQQGGGRTTWYVHR